MPDPTTQPTEAEEVLMLTEVFLVASCLFWEARSEGVQGLQLVYDVISNRAADPLDRWPNTKLGVVLQPKQFSAFNPEDKQSFPNPKKVGDWLQWIQCMRIAKAGKVQNTSVNHYHTNAVRPKWAHLRKVELVEGRHIFYAF